MTVILTQVSIFCGWEPAGCVRRKRSDPAPPTARLRNADQERECPPRRLREEQCLGEPSDWRRTVEGGFRPEESKYRKAGAMFRGAT